MSSGICDCDDFKAWVNINNGGYIGLCFRELILGSIPHLILVFGGLVRLAYIWSLKRDIKKVLKPGEKPLFVKLTRKKKIFFWVKFALCLTILLLAHSQVIYRAFMPLPFYAKLVADVLRAFFWGLCTVIIFLEYHNRMAHSAVVRWFWITSVATSIITEFYLLKEPVPLSCDPSNLFNMTINHNKTILNTTMLEYYNSTQQQDDVYRFFFFSFQFTLVLQTILATLGIFGFFRKNRKAFEPEIHPGIQARRRTDFSVVEMWKLINLHKWFWLLGVIFSIAKGVLTVVILDYIGTILMHVDHKQSEPHEQPNDDDWKSLLHFAITAGSAALCNTISLSLFGVAGLNMIRSIRIKIMKSLMSQDMTFFDTTSAGALISHLSGDTDKIGKIRDILPVLASSLAQVLTSCVYLYTINTKLTLVAIGLCFLEFLESSVRSRKVSQTFSRKYSEANKAAADRGTEILSSFSTVRLFVQEKKERASYARKVDSATLIGQKKEWLESIFEGAEMLMHAFIITVAVVYSLFNSPVDWNHNNEGLTDFILIGVTMIMAFQSFMKATIDFVDTSGSASTLNSIIDRQPAIDSDLGINVSEFRGIIEFKGVSFKYPEKMDSTNGSTANLDSIRSDPYIFKDFSLKIKEGTSCAIIGPSGAGKTTLFGLLLRFYDVTKGSIIIDKENDLRDINQKSWLSCVGVVAQEPILFKASVKENVLYSLDEAEQAKITPASLDEMLRKVAELSNLSSFIAEKGWDYQVGERGSALSISLRQRVCIARVFIKQPKILLLDEVTSNLDQASESEIVKALEQLMIGRTTLMISHRLHTLVHVDKICVIKDGTIIDQGTHEQLISHDGFYKSLWDKQQAELVNLQLPQSERGYSDVRGWGSHSHTHLTSDMRALLDLLNLHSEKLKENYPDIHSLLRQIRPERRHEWRRNTIPRKMTNYDETNSSREMKSYKIERTTATERQSLLSSNYYGTTLNDDEVTSSSSSSSGFF